MGYLDNFAVISHLLLIIGATITSGEPPLSLTYGSPGGSVYKMQKADMIYSRSSSNLVPMSVFNTNYQQAEGWTPFRYQPSYSSNLFEPLQNLAIPAATTQNYQASSPYVVQALVPSLNIKSNADSYATIPSQFQETRATKEILSDSDFDRSASNYYGPPPPPKVPSSSYGTPSFPSASYGTPSAPSTSYGTPSAPSAPSSSYGTPSAPSSSYGTPSESGPWDSTDAHAQPEKELRFVVHKDGEEDEVKSTLYKQFNRYGDMISFLRGPTFKFEKKQKLYLPPKPKTIVFVLLRTPELNTETEVIPSKEDPKPEVRIIYQKPEAPQVKHYQPEVGATSKPAPPPPSQGY